LELRTNTIEISYGDSQHKIKVESSMNTPLLVE